MPSAAIKQFWMHRQWRGYLLRGVLIDKGLKGTLSESGKFKGVLEEI